MNDVNSDNNDDQEDIDSGIIIRILSRKEGIYTSSTWNRNYLICDIINSMGIWHCRKEEGKC